MKNGLRYLFTAVVLSGIMISSGCEKDDAEVVIPKDESFNVKLSFHVDQVPLQFDKAIYQTPSGSNYSVNRLQFYLSRFVFKKLNGSTMVSNEIIYVDAREGTNVEFKLNKIPQGVYKSVEFYVGLNPAHNESNSLPATVENVNMAWPDMMGGGYHFMKFEGNYADSGNNYGFAMHIGKDAHLVKIKLTKPIEIKSGSDVFELKMNLNEWFKNPYTYDFNTDGNYSMGSDAAMMKLAANGVDVFNE